MRAACLGAVVVVLVLVGPACSSPPPPPPPPPPQLLPAETFDWSGQKISFAMPPTGWRREGETSGGIKGIRFVKEHSVGEGIGFGDYYILADRNRAPYIRDLLDKFDTFEYGFAWDKALRQAWAYTDTPFSALETEIAQRVNNSVSLAGTAFRNRDRESAKEHLQDALAEASRLRFSLADAIDRVEFKPEKKQNPEYYKMLGRRDAVIAGEPAVIVDYTVKVPERPHTYSAREVYFVHDSHMFICTFIGLPESLAVFDAMLESIAFPRELALGPHRVQVVVPPGWTLQDDQGQQKRFRRDEFEIALANLGPATTAQRAGSLADWGLAALEHDTRRFEVKSRRPTTVDGHEAVDVETWNRLDHTFPQRMFFVNAGGDLLALHTVRMALADSLKAFDAIRDSLRFVSPR